MKILHIDCSINSFEESITRKKSKEIVDSLSIKNNTEVLYRDLTKEKIPFITPEYQEAMFVTSKNRTEAENKTLAEFDLSPLLEADIYVFGIPGYFFNVPAVFKNWLEHIFRFGVTISDDWEGLLKNKKIFIVSAWGGIYTNTDIEKNFEGVITSSFKLLGIDDINFFHVYQEDGKTNILEVEERIKQIS